MLPVTETRLQLATGTHPGQETRINYYETDGEECLGVIKHRIPQNKSKQVCFLGHKKPCKFIKRRRFLLLVSQLILGYIFIPGGVRVAGIQSEAKMNFREFLCLLNICTFSERSPVVTIPALGQVRGSKMVSSSGRNFYAFRGIPYAKPPVGELRFRVSC